MGGWPYETVLSGSSGAAQVSIAVTVVSDCFKSAIVTSKRLRRVGYFRQIAISHVAVTKQFLESPLRGSNLGMVRKPIGFPPGELGEATRELRSLDWAPVAPGSASKRPMRPDLPFPSGY